jgi:hypothetical protein
MDEKKEPSVIILHDRHGKEYRTQDRREADHLVRTLGYREGDDAKVKKAPAPANKAVEPAHNK